MSTEKSNENNKIILDNVDIVTYNCSENNNSCFQDDYGGVDVLHASRRCLGPERLSKKSASPMAPHRTTAFLLLEGSKERITKNSAVVNESHTQGTEKKGGRDVLIHEAVCAAITNGGYIKRKTPIWEKYKLKPTDGTECCILYSGKKKVGPRWKQRAEDLMADDWILVSSD